MNTTDNIKSLFNSANPMATENIYEPSGIMTLTLGGSYQPPCYVRNIRLYG